MSVCTHLFRVFHLSSAVLITTLALTGCGPKIVNEAVDLQTDRMAQEAIEALARRDAASLHALGIPRKQADRLITQAPELLQTRPAEFVEDSLVGTSYMRFYVAKAHPHDTIGVELRVWYNERGSGLALSDIQVLNPYVAR